MRCYSGTGRSSLWRITLYFIIIFWDANSAYSLIVFFTKRPGSMWLPYALFNVFYYYLKRIPPKSRGVTSMHRFPWLFARFFIIVYIFFVLRKSILKIYIVINDCVIKIKTCIDLGPYRAIVHCPPLILRQSTISCRGVRRATLGSWSVPNRIFAHERSELIKCII